MKKYLITMLALLIGLNVSVAGKLIGQPVENPDKILKSVPDFLYYQQDYLRLYEDFKAYDAAGKEITKKQFLEQVCTGDYLPLKLVSKNEREEYQLYRLGHAVPKDVKDVIAQDAAIRYQQFLEEGQPFPPFKFVDLHGKVYNNQNTKGKVLVIKTWYIHCVNCRKEMPELNKLVAHYQNNKNVEFVSIALDPRDSLKAFLKKTAFNYAVASVPQSFIVKNLHISLYPTHIIVDRNGKIVKEVNQAEELEACLKKQL